MSETRNIVPRGDDEGNLGVPARRWKGVNAITFTGNLSGMATSAVNCDLLDGYHVSEDDIADTIPVRNSQGELIATSSQANSQNLLINGDLGIWQRGITSTASGYLADRWKVANDLTLDEGTVSRADIGYMLELTKSFIHGIRIQRTNIASPTGEISITQAIETANCQHLNGKSVTLSFYAKKLGGGDNITLEPKLLFGTGVDDGNPNDSMVGLSILDSSSSIGENNTAITGGDWQRYSYTWSLPTDWLSLRVKMEVNTQVLAPATGGFDITGIQLESGLSKTDFDHENVGEQWNKCQRYYEKLDGSIHNSAGSQYNGGSITFSTRKRVPPSISGLVVQTDGSYSTQINETLYTITGSTGTYHYISIDGAADAEIF